MLRSFRNPILHSREDWEDSKKIETSKRLRKILKEGGLFFF